jgi:PBP1b-binding outer membrane lipoprotein LpoB
MKRWFYLIWLAALATTGCEKQPTSSGNLKDAAKQTKAAFSSSGTETKSDAEKLAESLDQSDLASAMGRIESMSIRPDLEPKQREALANARMTVMEKLRGAAEAGDKQAAEMLETHRATK